MKSIKSRSLKNYILIIRAIKGKAFLLILVITLSSCIASFSGESSYYTDDAIINHYIQEIEKSTNSKVKRDACSKLSALNDQRTVNFFITMLKEEPEISACAARALGNLGDLSAIEPLKSKIYIASSTGQTTLNTPVVMALGQIGNKETLNFLVSVNQSFNPTDELGRGKKRRLEEVIQSLRQRLDN